MNNNKKLLKAGFRLFRLRDDATIWENRSGLAWTLFMRYDTKAAAKRAFNELMKNDMMLEG